MRKLLLSIILVGFFVAGCSDEPNKNESQTKESKKETIYTSSDALYSVTDIDNSFEDRFMDRIQIAEKRLPGTPTESLTLLLLSTKGEDSTSDIIYGLSLNIPKNAIVTVEQMKKNLDDVMQNAKGVIDHSFTAVEGSDNQLIYSIVTDNGEFNAYEKCYLSLSDKILTVCAASTSGNTIDVDKIISSVKFL